MIVKPSPGKFPPNSEEYTKQNSQLDPGKKRLKHFVVQKLVAF